MRSAVWKECAAYFSSGASPVASPPLAFWSRFWKRSICFCTLSSERRFWNSDLRIAGFEQVREIAFRPWAPDTIPRRYCAGVALISDGVERPVYYSIGEDTALIGATWGVEWCVVGVDRNWAFNPACKMAKP